MANHIPKPRILVASSAEGRAVLDAVVIGLAQDAQVTPWTSIFSLSGLTLDTIIHELSLSDFGIFIFTPDDEVKIRGESLSQARDNVLFELGLCIGSLSRPRNLILRPKHSNFRLPTDLLGVTLGEYDALEFDTNPVAALSSFCAQVRISIRKHFRITYPEIGFSGRNILFERSDLGLSAYSQESPVKYSLAAITSESQTVKVVMRNTSHEPPIVPGHPNIWQFPVHRVGAWVVEGYDFPLRTQVFYLREGQNGDMEIQFCGEGTVNAEVYENESAVPSRVLKLSWS